MHTFSPLLIPSVKRDKNDAFLILYRDRSDNRARTPCRAIKSQETATFFPFATISLFMATNTTARSLFYRVLGATPKGNVIFRIVDNEQKGSVENGKEIKWWVITSAKLIRCTECTGKTGSGIPGSVPRDAYRVAPRISTWARTFLESFNADR